MKTKFKTLTKSQKNSILENRNFLNNQNYIKDNNSKLYLDYFIDYNFFEFILYIVLFFIFLGLGIILGNYLINIVGEIGPLIFIIGAGLLFMIPMIISNILMKNIKSKRYRKNNKIYYLEPYSNINTIITHNSKFNDSNINLKKYEKKLFCNKTIF